MKYIINKTGKKSFSGITVEHNGETLFFSGTGKVSNGDADEELFEFLNVYFETLTQDQLKRHWEVLKSGKRILEPGYFGEENDEIIELRQNNLDYEFLNRALAPVLNKAYANIKPSEISYAADALGFTNPPPDLNYITSQGDYPEETTINDDKYRKLAKLTFTGQLVYPILNQLLDHISIVTGKTFKDGAIGELIEMVKPITEMAGYHTLDTYLRASCLRQESRRNSTAIISDVKYIDNIVYKGLLSKLCLTFIPSHIEKKNLTNELNSLVAGEIRGDNSARFKSYGDPKPIGDDQSIQESTTVTEVINSSDELAMCMYFSNTIQIEVEPGVYKLAEKGFYKSQCLGLGIKDQAMAEKVFLSLPTASGFILNDMHVKLLQLVYQDEVPYMLYYAMDYTQLMSAIALGQVMLYEMGFEHLACCLHATRNNEVHPSFVDDAYKLTTRERDALVELCGEYIGQQTGTTDNVLVKATMDFLEELAGTGWDSNIEPGLLGNKEFLELMSPNHRYTIDITPVIKQELLALITLKCQP